MVAGHGRSESDLVLSTPVCAEGECGGIPPFSQIESVAITFLGLLVIHVTRELTVNPAVVNAVQHVPNKPLADKVVG